MKGNCQNQNAQTKDSGKLYAKGRSELESKAIIRQKENNFGAISLMAKSVLGNPLKQEIQYRSLLFQ